MEWRWERPNGNGDRMATIFGSYLGRPYRAEVWESGAVTVFDEASGCCRAMGMVGRCWAPREAARDVVSGLIGQTTGSWRGYTERIDKLAEGSR